MEFIVAMLLECILLSHTIRVYSALGIGNRIDIGLGHNKWLMIERERRERQNLIFQRSRRNAEGNNCGSPDNVIRHQFALKDDNNANIKLFWVGKNFQTQLLITTFEFRVFLLNLRKKSILYRSNNQGLTFEQMEGQVKDADIRATFGIVKSEVNPLKVILIGFSGSFSKSTTTLFISEDGTKTWKTVHLPFEVRSDEPIVPHLKNENWLLALEEGGFRAAWLSLDFGSNWLKLKDNVHSVKWGADTGKPDDDQIIFVTVKRFFAGIFMTPDSSLWRSKDLGKSFHKLHDNIYSIGIQGVFLFISVDLHSLFANYINGADRKGLRIVENHTFTPDIDRKSRVMHISKNNGDVFHRVRVPEVTPEMFYAILDVSEGQIFLHVDDPEDTGKGTLYISDADGILYSKSLENHFYTNDAVTDYYKVESMKGVFLTHQLQKDSTLQSVITFDRGASWNDLFLTDKQCEGTIIKANKRCSLHYHHTFSQQKGHLVQGPLSSATAFGLILLHGVSGDALHTNHTSVYLSRNGGYNWTKVLDGPHHYAIGDHGNLIVAVPRDLSSNKTDNTLKYSLDQGRCWTVMSFTSDPMIVRGLVTEPHSKKRAFSIWGIIKTDVSRVWQVVTINFENILQRRCNKDDYEYWSPHTVGSKDGCYLGVKEKYPRVKQKVYCYSGEEYEPEIITDHCKCTLNDLECEYGFVKDTVGKCIRDNSVKLEICRHGDVEKMNEGEGYRRIPGDRCKGGKEELVTKLVEYIDTKLPCDPKDLDSYGFSQNGNSKKEEKANGISKGLLAFGLIIILVILTSGAVYISKKFYQNRARTHSSYRYSQLASDEDILEEVNGYDKVRTGMTEYKDESDIESDTELLKL